MSSEGLDVRAIREAVDAMNEEHPRHFIVLCHEDDYAMVNTAVHEAEDALLDYCFGSVVKTIEVRSHKFAKVGECYLMRDPRDWQAAWHRVPLAFGGGRGAGEAGPSAASA